MRRADELDEYEIQAEDHIECHYCGAELEIGLVVIETNSGIFYCSQRCINEEAQALDARYDRN